MAEEKPAGPKIGEGTGGGMLRMGLGEIRNSLYSGSNVAQQTEYGIYGTKTPGEIAEDRRAIEGPSLEDERNGSVLQQSLRQAETRTPEKATRDKDMER